MNTIPNLKDHLSCDNYDKLSAPVFDLRHSRPDTAETGLLERQRVVFLIKGELRIFPSEDQTCVQTIRRGYFFYTPLDRGLYFESSPGACFIVINLHGHLCLCEGCMIDHLYMNRDRMIHWGECREGCPFIQATKINTPLSLFMEGLRHTIRDGLKCRYFTESKIKEFLILLRVYYSGRQLRQLFYLMLSTDHIFSEYVKSHHEQYKTLNDLAIAMHYTPKKFSKKFKDVFGQTAHEWLKEKKMKIIHNEICRSDKPFKQIAYDQGFSEQSQLNRFCKECFGKTPGEMRKATA